MSSRSINTNKSVNEVFPKVQQIIATSGFVTKSLVPNQSIQAEGSRDYGLGLLIVFIILLWPVAIIYYFTRKKNSVIVLLTQNNDGLRVDITSDGISADKVLQLILNVLQ